MERDNYGKVFDQSITPPDSRRAYYTSDKKDEIALEFDQPMVWKDALASQFYLDGQEGKVASGAVSGNVVTLKLTRRPPRRQSPISWTGSGIPRTCCTGRTASPRSPSARCRSLTLPKNQLLEDHGNSGNHPAVGCVSDR